MRHLLFLAALLLPAALASAQQQPAPTPPMGWNSWDSFGLTISETQFRANVDVLAAKLAPFGYNYAVVDEGWYFLNPLDRPSPDKLQYSIDANGRFTPVPERFPSALQHGVNTGFTALAAELHARNLKFGIHIIRGIPRIATDRNTPIAGSRFTARDAADTAAPCPWDPTSWGVKDTPAGQAWYDSLLTQYAAWGVDFLKVDCVSDHPYAAAEIRMIHRAILKTGRPIVLSLSPGPTSPGHAAELPALAQMTRVSDDFWDVWRSQRPWPYTLYGQFPLAAAWSPYSGNGFWPDLDMLPLGYLGPIAGEGAARDTRFTHDEQRTLLTLWAIARSPLILGANLTRLDDWTLQLLTNRDVLAVDQHSHGQLQAAMEGDTIYWTSFGPGATRYVAVFNRADQPVTVSHSFAFLNLPAPAYAARELWTQQAYPAAPTFTLTLAPHASALLQLTP